MSNMLDYLKWRGDLSFSQDPFNEVDNLIFSIICYNEFDGIVPKLGDKGTVKLSQAAERFKKEKNIDAIIDLPFLKEIPNLLEQAGKSKRFGETEISNYINIVDLESTKQFSAVVFKIAKDLHVIAYRGTDDSLIGWKEDLQMSFLDEIQSQAESVSYTEKIFKNIKSNFILVGHSKGGNLAVYAGTLLNNKYEKKIHSIYNNDGPGFQPKVVESKEYKDILHKTSTFLPESSIIGMFLEHGGDYEVVKSKGIAILQHNPFLWELLGKTFIRKEELSKDSLNINRTVRGWITQLTNEERADFVEALFEILEKTGAETIADLNNEKFIMAEAMIKAYSKMDKSTKEHLKTTIDLFFKEGKKVIRQSISQEIEAFRSKTWPKDEENN